MSVTELTLAPFWSIGRCEITLLESDWLNWSKLQIHFCLTLLKQIQRHGIPALESQLHELQGVYPHQGGKHRRHRRDELQSTTGRSVHKSTGNYWFLTLWNQMQNNSFFQFISFLLKIDIFLILVQIAVVAAQHPGPAQPTFLWTSWESMEPLCHVSFAWTSKKTLSRVFLGHDHDGNSSNRKWPSWMVLQGIGSTLNDRICLNLHGAILSFQTKLPHGNCVHPLPPSEEDLLVLGQRMQRTSTEIPKRSGSSTMTPEEQEGSKLTTSIWGNVVYEDHCWRMMRKGWFVGKKNRFWGWCSHQCSTDLLLSLYISIGDDIMLESQNH